MHEATRIKQYESTKARASVVEQTSRITHGGLRTEYSTQPGECHQSPRRSTLFVVVYEMRLRQCSIGIMHFKDNDHLLNTFLMVQLKRSWQHRLMERKAEFLLQAKVTSVPSSMTENNPVHEHSNHSLRVMVFLRESSTNMLE